MFHQTAQLSTGRRVLFLRIAALLIATAVAGMPQRIITTLAGTNFFFPNNVTGVDAPLGSPGDVAFGPNRQLYFIDGDNALIFTQTSDGVVHIVAGNGVPGLSGDGGPATAASIAGYSMAIDIAGYIYFADWQHNVVREVSPSGAIKTIAGTGQSGFSGDGGPALLAQLYEPRGVAVDPEGNVFISTLGANYALLVRRISPSGVITTFAGGGTTYTDGLPATSVQLSGQPGPLATGPSGEVFLASGLYGDRKSVV